MRGLKKTDRIETLAVLFHETDRMLDHRKHWCFVEGKICRTKKRRLDSTSLAESGQRLIFSGENHSC
jgi:hypothetical protein